MKKIKNILGVILVLIGMTTVYSCQDDAPEYKASPNAPAGTVGVYFPTTNVKAHELMPTDPTEFEMTIARTVSDGAVDVPIIQDVNDDNVFVVPASVSFAAGEKEKTFKVKFPTALEGKKYNLKLSVAGDQFVNPYIKGAPYVATNVTRVKWEAVPDMVYVDGTISNFFGVDILPMYVKAEKAVLGGATRYRFKNIFKTATEDPDEDGIWTGYPYYKAYYDNSKEHLTIIEIGGPNGGKNDVFMPRHEIGLAIAAYGNFSIGSVYPTLSSNKGSYPLGTFDSKKGTITFPPNSLFSSMAKHQDGGSFPNSDPSTFYLTKAAYLKANMAIEDFNDLEYETIEGEESAFASKAFGQSWPQTLGKAIDVDPDNPKSDYKDLYYLADLYEDGYGVAFYYNKESGKVTIPKNQPIGAKVFGQDLYVSPSENIKSSVETKENGLIEYTLGMMFHYKDGTIVGNFAERYLYSKKALSYDLAAYIGSFTMTGNSAFTNIADAVMNVKIAKGKNNNELVITGVQYAKEIIATFDPVTTMISIKPQVLANFQSYDMTLKTITVDGNTLNISETAIINLKRNIQGDVYVDAYSEAIGYVLDSKEAGGFVNGFYDLVFTPRAEKKTSIATTSSNEFKVHSTFTPTRRLNNTKTKVNNFKVQGNKSSIDNTKVKKDVQTSYILR